MTFSISTRKLTIFLIHSAFWILLFSLPSLLRPVQENNLKGQAQIDQRFVYQYLINCITWICLFYLNSDILIPRLINKKKYLKFVLILIPVFASLYFINWLSVKLLLPQFPFSFQASVIFYLLPCVFFLSCSTAIAMFRNKLQSDKLEQQKENENLKTELSFLRSQVSPHFMFNVLNNMVVLARKKSEQLEPSLFKLSSLLRYMLYETDEDKVLLDKEIEYLESYIDLQLQRFGSRVTVNKNFNVPDKGLLIEPMLLIPFVENAFKHGTGLKQKGEINIDLKAYNKSLEFTVSNLYDSTMQQLKDKTSGIGLQNVRRRLDLLYKEGYTLSLDDKNGYYSVVLKLKLH